MKNRVYLDTNIVADIIDASRVSHENSLKCIKKLVLQNYDICISEDMLSTLYYISKNKEVTLEFFQNVIFVDWHVLSFGRGVIEKAVQLGLSEKLDLEDLLQCLCAKENGCDILLSNDKQFFDCGMKVMTTEIFLSKQANNG